MKKIVNEKGITLVSLVITIIILLILAGISIQSITNTGLFGKAKEAKRATENAQLEENKILENYLEQIDKISNGKDEEKKKQDSAEKTTATTHTATSITYEWNEIAEMAKIISNTSSINEDTLEVKVKINNETKILGVGDTKTLDGKTVRILGFNHDTLSEPNTAYGTVTTTGKAGISFEYADIFIESVRMNSNATTEGGWEKTELRGTLNSTTYNSLSIKNNIKKVKKDYIPTYNVAATQQTEDYLWLLSCGEIWDNGYNGGITRGYAIATEGKQYKYYKVNLGSTSYNNENSITIKPNMGSGWGEFLWLRSPADTGYGDKCFCEVNYDGKCKEYDQSFANTYALIAPGFSI